MKGINAFIWLLTFIYAVHSMCKRMFRFSLSCSFAAGAVASIRMNVYTSINIYKYVAIHTLYLLNTHNSVYYCCSSCFTFASPKTHCTALSVCIHMCIYIIFLGIVRHILYHIFNKKSVQTHLCFINLFIYSRRKSKKYYFIKYFSNVASACCYWIAFKNRIGNEMKRAH